MNEHEFFMQRCLQLAASGSGKVAPNPMVGAVLVHQGTIIGEGFHMQYGSHHAEVNCLHSVPASSQHLIAESTLYVSLEPCCHHGKTPPCTDLIIENRIPRVVVGCLDTTEKVNGSGIQRLRDAGIEVTSGILESDCLDLNKRFFTFHTKKRPYIILKWAQTADGFIGAPGKRIKISNEITDRLVHKWRSEESAILIGSKTAVSDDPTLTTRLYPGNDPLRVIIDPSLKLPPTHRIFNDHKLTLVINNIKNAAEASVSYRMPQEPEDLLLFTLDELYQLNILSVLVEGGAFTLNRFLEAGLWDEARIIINRDLNIGSGVVSPFIDVRLLSGSEELMKDSLFYYQNLNS